MNLQPYLSNDLVAIRPLRLSDQKALFDVAKDPLIWEQHTTHDRWQPEGFKTFFEESIKSLGALVIIDKKSEKIIGSSRYKMSEVASNAVEIGWSFLARAYWGGECNRAFKTLMIEHALESIDHVLFFIDRDNIRSQKATLKLGGKRIMDNDLAYLRSTKPNYNSYVITSTLEM